VVTFLEDALRIMTQWGDQLVYLHDYRHSKLLPYPGNHEKREQKRRAAGGGHLVEESNMLTL